MKNLYLSYLVNLRQSMHRCKRYIDKIAKRSLKLVSFVPFARLLACIVFYTAAAATGAGYVLTCLECVC